VCDRKTREAETKVATKFWLPPLEAVLQRADSFICLPQFDPAVRGFHFYVFGCAVLCQFVL
jgi:hypothetical protein